MTNVPSGKVSKGRINPTQARDINGAVEPRKRPQQARSQLMVERILDAAQRQLKEEGAKGLTTTAIAKRAGLSAGSLYQYFPNKEAIVLALFRRWLTAFRAVIDPQIASPAPANWKALKRQLWANIQAIAQIYWDNADLQPVLQTMGLNPTLRRIDREHREAVIDAFATWILRINPALERSVAVRLGIISLEAGHACYSVAVSQSARQYKEMLRDIESMQLSLLRPYLGLK
jgi:AcrR family transcriptional regulator